MIWVDWIYLGVGTLATFIALGLCVWLASKLFKILDEERASRDRRLARELSKIFKEGQASRDRRRTEQ